MHAVGAVPYCGLVCMLAQAVSDLYLAMHMFSCIPVIYSSLRYIQCIATGDVVSASLCRESDPLRHVNTSSNPHI